MKRKSIRFKKWVAFVTVLLANFLVIISLYISVNKETEKKIIKDLGEKLNHIAVSAVAGISQKEHRKLYVQFRLKGNEAVKSKEFISISNHLKKIQNANSLETDVYTVFIPSWDPENMIFLGMSSDVPYLGNGTEVTPVVKRVYDTGKPQRSNVYKAKSGEWISGAAPVFDRKGKVQAVLQADFRTDLVLAGAREEAFKKLIIPILYIMGVVTVVLLIGLHFLMRSLELVLNNNIEELVKSSSYIKDSSVRTTSFSNEIMSMNERQLSFVNETSVSFDQINKISIKTAKDTNNAVKIAKTTISKMQAGQEDIKQMTKGIHSLNDSNTKLMNRMNIIKSDMERIVSIITEISAKTNVINDIVFQTKLLSFNASVEAARAGEHGKGFAVVAEEIGTLANQSGESSVEISDILSQGFKTVGQIVESTDSEVTELIGETQSCISHNVKMGEDFAISMREISANFDEVISLMGNVDKSIQDQAEGVSGVNTKIQILQGETGKYSEVSGMSKEISVDLDTQVGCLEKVVVMLQETTGKK